MADPIFSWWRALPAAAHQLPGHLAAALDSKREYTAKLLRSPERVIGLGDATRVSARTRAFGLTHALNLSYAKDHRFILLTCLLVGFGLWWAVFPEPLLWQPSACCSPEYASMIRDPLNLGVCPLRFLGFPCPHIQHYHDQVMEVFSEPESFDPLQIQPDRKTLSLAVMIGVIILALALGDSVTPEGTLL